MANVITASPKYKAVCPRCECTFAFTKLETSSNEDGTIHSIKCPNKDCGSTVVLGDRDKWERLPNNHAPNLRLLNPG